MTTGKNICWQKHGHKKVFASLRKVIPYSVTTGSPETKGSRKGAKSQRKNQRDEGPYSSNPFSVNFRPRVCGRHPAHAAGVFVPGVGNSRRVAGDLPQDVHFLAVFSMIPHFSSSRPAAAGPGRWMSRRTWLPPARRCRAPEHSRRPQPASRPERGPPAAPDAGPEGLSHAPRPPDPAWRRRRSTPFRDTTVTPKDRPALPVDARRRRLRHDPSTGRPRRRRSWRRAPGAGRHAGPSARPSTTSSRRRRHNRMPCGF